MRHNELEGYGNLFGREEARPAKSNPQVTAQWEAIYNEFLGVFKIPIGVPNRTATQDQPF